MKVGLPKNDHLLPKLKEVFAAQAIYLEEVGSRHYLTSLYGDDFYATACLMKQKTIVDLVAAKYLDAGIAGLDCVLEFNTNAAQKGKASVQILESLKIGQCMLKVAVDKRNSRMAEPQDLQGKRIATPFPGILQRFLDSKGVRASAVIAIDSSVEAAVPLGIADAVMDIVETGRSLNANGLKPIFDVMSLHAVVIAPATTNLQSDDYMQLHGFTHQLTTPRLPQASIA